MLKKLIILTLITLVPLTAWAIPISYKFEKGKKWNVLSGLGKGHGLSGSISGDWDGSGLSGITGSLLSKNGKVRVNINGGSLNKNGRGNWIIDIIKENKTYSGILNFKNKPYLKVTETKLKIWGGSKLSCTKSNGSSCGRKWFGLDAKGPGSTVPGPAPFVVMGIGLVGFIIASKVRRKNSIGCDMKVPA